MFTGHSLLLIDPNQLTAFLSAQVLQHSRLINRFEVVHSAFDGLDHLLSCQYQAPDKFPQVLVIDSTLPEMNGFEFLQEFRQRFPKLNGHTPAIFLLTDEKHEFHTVRTEAQAWPEVKGTIGKPLTLESLWEVWWRA